MSVDHFTPKQEIVGERVGQNRRPHFPFLESVVLFLSFNI